jgi:hypothetical protein
MDGNTVLVSYETIGEMTSKSLVKRCLWYLSDITGQRVLESLMPRRIPRLPFREKVWSFAGTNWNGDEDGESNAAPAT